MKKALKKFVKIWDKSEDNELSAGRNEFSFNYSGGYIDITDNSLPKLHNAVWYGQIENVRKLLKRNDVNCVDSYNRTTLHLAVAQCNNAIIQLLLNSGANAEIADSDGLTPFLKAVEIGNMDIVRLLLEYDIDVNVTDNKGNTALHLAVLYGFCNIVALLLLKNVERNRTNKNGDTPLHIATHNEYLELVDLLLKNGADYNVPDLKNRTPIMLALKCKNIPLLKIFMYHGAHKTLSKDLVDPALQDIIFGHDDNTLTHKNEVVVSVNCKIENSSPSDFEHLVHDVNEDSCKDISISKDEDSQISLQSCIIPPILKPVRSWNVIQSGMIHKTNLDADRNNMEFLKSSMDAKTNTTSGFSSYSINDENSDTIDVTCDRLETLKETASILESNNSSRTNNSVDESIDNRRFTTENVTNEDNTNRNKVIANNNSFVNPTDNQNKSVDAARKRARCKSLTISGVPQIGLRDKYDKPVNNYDTIKASNISSQLKTYNNALKRLSLEAISITNTGQKRLDLSPFIAKSYENQNDANNDNVEINKIEDIQNRHRKTFQSNPNETFKNESDEQLNTKPKELLATELEKFDRQTLPKNRQKLFEMTTEYDKSYSAAIVKNNSDDSSSDNDPPFWRNSGYGGYFVKQSTVISNNVDGSVELHDDINLKKFQNAVSSSSDEDLVQSGLKNELVLDKPFVETFRNVIWDHLKEVSQDKGELEDVTLSLRETTEKLKYDLENSRQIMTNKDDTLTALARQLYRLDEKYIRTTEQMNEFKYCMKNLEQEVLHLTEICNKANNSNQRLIQRVQYLIDNNNSANEEKHKLMNQNIADIQKLQSDVLFWREKHDVLMQKFENENIKDFIKKVDDGIKNVINEIQMLKEKDINMEINNKEDYIMTKRNYSSNHNLNSNDESVKTKISEDDNPVCLLTQKIINKSEEKLYTLLSEIKNILDLKFEQTHKEEVDRNKLETRMIRDFENAKQKYMLEISRLASLLKFKEEEERKLKEQYNHLCNRIQSVKDQKRKQLITKSYSLSIIPTKNFSDDNPVSYEQTEIQDI